jgi:predicted SnoaL-like aldol condensation-catalyzing enzyme
VTWTEVTLYRVADGTILEDWNSADFLGLLQQSSVVPPMSLTGV